MLNCYNLQHAEPGTKACCFPAAPAHWLAIMLLQKKMLPVNVVLAGRWEPATAFRRASPLCVSRGSHLRGAHCKVLEIGSFGDVTFSFLAWDNSLGDFRAQHIHWKSLVHVDTFKHIDFKHIESIPWSVLIQNTSILFFFFFLSFPSHKGMAYLLVFWLQSLQQTMKPTRWPCSILTNSSTNESTLANSLADFLLRFLEKWNFYNHVAYPSVRYSSLN